MEDEEQKTKEKNFIKILVLLLIQETEIIELNKKPIEDIDNPLKYYLVNRDIIDNYKYLKLYSEVSKCVEKLKTKNSSIFNFNYCYKNDNVIDAIIQTIDIEKNKFKIDETVLPLFFETEKLKINGFEYPYNFFILRKEILDLFFKIGIINNNNSEFSFNKEYNLLLGKEGVFIWNPIKQKDFIVVYFLNKWNSEINKIYLYKEEKDFLNELNKNIKGKSICDYFNYRNIKNKEIGFYNLIYDGKIFGRYINIMRTENYEEEKNETVDIKLKYDNIIQKDEQNKFKIENFLKNLLISLYNIDDLRKFCKDVLNDRNNIINEKNDKMLIDSFSEFIIGMEKNTRKSLEASNFVNLFNEKNLGENIEFNKGHINRAYENLIIKVIDTFVSEIKIKQNLKNDLNNKENKKIFQLFYGLKYDNESGSSTYFNTLNINPKKFIEKKKIDLNKIINSFEFNESGIINLPEILILVFDNDNYKNIKDSDNNNDITDNTDNKNIKIFIHIPLEIMIDKGEFKKRYTFLSSFQYNDNLPDNFYTIVKKKEKFLQIQFDTYKNIYEEKIIDQNTLSESFIFFYEKMKEDQYSSGNNSIYDNTNNNAINNSNNNINNNSINNSNNYIINNTINNNKINNNLSKSILTVTDSNIKCEEIEQQGYNDNQLNN